MEERRCLVVDLRIGLLAEGRGAWPRERGLKQPVVADLGLRPEGPACDVQERLEGRERSLAEAP